ncbi:PAS domain S-box protein [uncultured Desulfobulbus sp.]|uniref:PAS domain S-box protein n=1 Tax=uncultured Desulfobulbus sp. TaxID=239745 RepID=UPI0029C8C1F9|nr:PAS domain S-box protein [uncultured Desulfobulbus sp.]
MQENNQPLTTSDLQLQFILNASPVGMLVFNEREEIILANPTAEKLFDLSSNTNSLKRCGDFIRCTNRLRTPRGCGHSPSCPSCPLLRGLRATLAGKATTDDQEDEATLNREPGCEPLWIRYKIKPLAINGQRGALLTVDDITALRRSEQQYAQLFREMLDAFALHEILCDDQGNPVDYRFLAVNPAFERIIGLNAAQIVGHTVLSILPHTEPHWITTYGKVALTGEPIRFENYSGEIGKHFSINAYCPAPGQFACLIKDITERKWAETSLKESEARMRAITDAAKDAILVMDPEGRVSFWNPAAEKIFGFSEKEVIGRNLHRLIAPQRYHEAHEKTFPEFLQTGQGKAIGNILELQARHKNGAEIPIELSLSSVLLPEGWHTVGIIRNITERKQAEEAIRLNEARLRRLVDILQHPAENTRDFLDNALEQAIQLTESTIGYIYHYHEDRQEFVLNAWSKEVMPSCAVANPLSCYQLEKTGLWGEAVRQRRPIVVNDFQAAHPLKKGLPEGHVQLQNFMTVPIFRNDRIVSVVGLANKATDYEEADILQVSLLIESVWHATERKLMEEERKRLQAQLTQAQKMEAIGTLAGGIAHDFNNILGAILGYAEMARDGSPHGSAVSKDLNKVLEAGHRAAALVKQILAFSRQNASERVALDPARIVNEVFKLLRPSLPSTIAIRQQTAATRSVLADPTQMHQILMNLCTNAFHAMEQTGGVLDISLSERKLSAADLGQRPGAQPGSFVVLAVSDTGPGIDPEIRERIFDPYFTTKGVGQGTGLGLSIAHGIVADYGGFITCGSELGRGTVFRVFLPAIEGAAPLEVAATEPVPAGKEHILLVDDEELLSEMGRTMLERLGYAVTVRTSSLDALAAFQNEPDRFDAVITDQTMPGMTGIDLARRMLQIRPRLPIILCTGYSNLVTEDQAKSYGIKGFAMKPLTKKAVATLLRTVLDLDERGY